MPIERNNMGIQSEKVNSAEELESIKETIKANQNRLPVYILFIINKLINTVSEKFKTKEE